MDLTLELDDSWEHINVTSAFNFTINVKDLTHPNVTTRQHAMNVTWYLGPCKKTDFKLVRDGPNELISINDGKSSVMRFTYI